MTVIGLIYLGYLLARYGRRSLAMPDMRSIDAQAAGQAAREKLT